MAGAQRGSPSPSPTPSPNALSSGAWRLRTGHGVPTARGPPAHHDEQRWKKACVSKKGGKERAPDQNGAKQGRSYDQGHTPPVRTAKIPSAFATCPLPRSRGNSHGLRRGRPFGTMPSAHPPSRAIPAFRRAHPPATPHVTTVCFHKTSPGPSRIMPPGDRQQRLPAASRVSVKRPYERFLGDGGA